MGRVFVLSTSGSIFLSHKSLTTQPAALLARVHTIPTPITVMGGLPCAAKNIAHNAGIIKISLPSGLCHRKSLTIVNQTGSELCSGVVSIGRKLINLILMNLRLYINKFCHTSLHTEDIFICYL